MNVLIDKILVHKHFARLQVELDLFDARALFLELSKVNLILINSLFQRGFALFQFRNFERSRMSGIFQNDQFGKCMGK